MTLLLLAIKQIYLDALVKVLDFLCKILGVESKWEYFTGSDISDFGKSVVVMRRNKKTGVVETLDERWQPKQ